MSRRWIALIALCFAELLVMVDNTIVNVALPTMARDLDAGTSGLQWIVDAYTLVFAGLLLTGGYLGDRFGHRRILVVGIAGFMAVSVGAASAGSLAQLVAGRAGLGAFAALVFPATLALIVAIFEEGRARAAAVGAWAATSGVAVAVGPVLGGWLLEHFSWPAVFWVNLPMGAAALAAVLLTVSADRPGKAGRLDLPGLLLSMAGLGILTFSVIEGPQAGWLSVQTLGGLGVAAVALGLFIRRQLTVDHPILDVRLFTNRFFSGAALLVSIAFFSLFGFIFLITQFFQSVNGYSPLEAGLRTLPFAVVMAAFSPLAMALAHRVGPRVVITGGAAIMSLGYGLVMTADHTSGYWAVIIWPMSLMAVGLAFISGPCTQLIMDSLRPEQAGAGAAVNDTTREVGGTLGVAVLGSVLTSVYTSGVTDRLAGLGLPDDLTASSAESVMAGITVAEQTPAPLRDEVRVAVQEVFVDGLHDASWVAVAVTALAAGAAAVMLRGRPAAQSKRTLTVPVATTTPAGRE